MWCDTDHATAAKGRPDPDAWTAPPLPALLFCGWALPADEPDPPPKRAPATRRRGA